MAYVLAKTMGVCGVMFEQGTAFESIQHAIPGVDAAWLQEAIRYGHVRLVEVAPATGPVSPTQVAEAKPDPTNSGDDDAGEPNATSAARDLAETHGVDLSQVTGSGAGGRITAPDVRVVLLKSGGSGGGGGGDAE